MIELWVCKNFLLQLEKTNVNNKIPGEGFCAEKRNGVHLENIISLGIFVLYHVLNGINNIML